MINPGLQKYEVVLADQYFLRELLENVSMEDSLDDISYRANVRLVVTPDFPGIEPGQDMRVSGVPFGGTDMTYLLHPGVVWDCDSQNRGQKHLAVTIYDKTIYLAKSEDEYLFPAGQTVTQRIKIYAADWDIPLAQIPDTRISLAKAVYRSQSIWSMIQADLKETVTKGGDMYRPRMTPDGLELYKLGSNETVWVLEEDQNVQDVSQKRTLEGTITKVKIVGNAEDNQRSPVLAVLSGETAKYGTLQKIITKEKDDSLTNATTKGNSLLCGIQETFSVQGIDINTVRAGDKVKYNSMDLLVTSIRHDLGSPGKMTAELADEAYVRRRYFGPV